MTVRQYEFNELINWKQILLKARQVAFLCPECKKEMTKTIKCIERKIEKILEVKEGILV